MERYHGGEVANKGVYVNLSNGELVQHYAGTKPLPGDEGTKYIRVPAALAILGGPLVGLAFVIFVPFIGIVGIISFLAYKVGRAAVALANKALQPAMIDWVPGRAFLTRKGQTEKQGKSTAEPVGEPADSGINELEDEIVRRRQQGEQ